MRGAKPKPTKLKILAGNPGRRPLPKDEPKPRGKAVMPQWLNAEARVVWQELAPVTESLGLLTDHDAEQFGTLCTELAAYRKDPAGTMTSRITVIKALFAEFGMGPSARTRISVPKKGDGSDEARFFGREA